MKRKLHSTIVDRVAEKMYEAQNGTGDWEQYIEGGKDSWRTLAVAAINEVADILEKDERDYD